MSVQELYSILSNIEVIIVKNFKDIFTGMADDIPLALMDEWVDCIKIVNDDLAIILK